MRAFAGLGCFVALCLAACSGDYGSGLLRMQADIVFFVEEVHAVGR